MYIQYGNMAYLPLDKLHSLLGNMAYLPLDKLHSLLPPPHARTHTHLQKDLLKTKETLYRLAASVRQLPDRYNHCNPSYDF